MQDATEDTIDTYIDEATVDARLDEILSATVDPATVRYCVRADVDERVQRIHGFGYEAIEIWLLVATFLRGAVGPQNVDAVRKWAKAEMDKIPPFNHAMAPETMVPCEEAQRLRDRDQYEYVKLYTYHVLERMRDQSLVYRV